MGAQFNSWRYPVYLLLPVPLALAGALWLVWALGSGLDIFGLLGMLMLIGLSAKNAILYLDFVVERMKLHALPGRADRVRAAALPAHHHDHADGARHQLPAHFRSGQGAEFGQKLGIVMLGGIISSTILTFFVVPAAFYLFERSRHPDTSGGWFGALRAFYWRPRDVFPTTALVGVTGNRPRRREEIMAGILTEKSRAEREQRVRAVVAKLAHEVPELANLDPQTLEKVARVAMLDDVKGRLKKAAELECIDYQVERELFIERASKTRLPADKEAIRLGPGPPGSLVRKAGYFPAGTQSCPGRRLD